MHKKNNAEIQQTITMTANCNSCNKQLLQFIAGGKCI